jgi:hypothetical protein
VGTYFTNIRMAACRVLLYGCLPCHRFGLRLAKITFPDMAPRDVIDSTAEAFSLYPEHLVFSPLTFKKRWTKAMGFPSSVALPNYWKR